MEPRTTIWRLDEHSRGKHLVLKHYLGAWFAILGMTKGRILFVDGFAGPGEYRGGELGSPIIALDAFVRHSARSRIKAEVLFLCIERDLERSKHLRQLIKQRYPSLPDCCRVRVETDSFDTSMNPVLDEVELDGAPLAPSFVMIDPFGVSGAPMSVVRRILGNPSCEVYVSFMIEAIGRFSGAPEFAQHLDSLFGCPDWRDGNEVDDGDERRQFFYRLYEAQLRASGATQVIRFELFEGGRLVYAIFFASQSSLGANRMKEAIWKVAKDGSFAIRGGRGGQLLMDLTIPPNFTPLQNALVALSPSAPQPLSSHPFSSQRLSPAFAAASSPHPRQCPPASSR